MNTDMFVGGDPVSYDRTRDTMLIGKAMAQGHDVFIINDKAGYFIDITTSEQEASHIAQKENRGRGYNEARIYKRNSAGHMYLVGVSKRTSPVCGMHMKVA